MNPSEYRSTGMFVVTPSQYPEVGCHAVASPKARHRLLQPWHSTRRLSRQPKYAQAPCSQLSASLFSVLVSSFEADSSSRAAASSSSRYATSAAHSSQIPVVGWNVGLQFGPSGSSHAVSMKSSDKWHSWHSISLYSHMFLARVCCSVLKVRVNSCKIRVSP